MKLLSQRMPDRDAKRKREHACGWLNDAKKQALRLAIRSNDNDYHL
ncbi:hypothetical protein [Janthinobacterium fluminis]|uniref:Uncharacterized protein n=1 Tax=Janthinobacterium fluminis TaxID=2987524 RepID=A0ABT5K2C7_9BURK|nr:hypothetical protein [Janthinobacterium fluminis]MDC8759144.1 hypothetical protein [Janthinobacterium fluminis]